jgi:hypothetical protein
MTSTLALDAKQGAAATAEAHGCCNIGRKTAASSAKTNKYCGFKEALFSSDEFTQSSLM